MSKREERIQEIEDFLLGDLLGIPKMHLELCSNPPHLKKIEGIYKILKQKGSLPLQSDVNKTGVLINIANGKPQMVDGHHRVVALLLHDENATIKDIRFHIRDVWINGVDSNNKKQEVHVHILASMLEIAPQTYGEDGAVKKIGGDIQYDDPQHFSPNSAGRPLKQTAQEIREKRGNQFPL